MISKKIRKIIVVTLSITTVLSSNNFVVTSSVSQMETTNEPVQILSEEDEVLNQEEIENLIQENEKFSRIYEQQMSQGETLQEVTVTTVEVQDKSRAKKNGKIYDSSFRQPVKRKTVYLNKVCNTLSGLINLHYLG